MKVLIVNTLYSPYKIGGAERSVQEFAENLAMSGVEVGVLTLGEKEEFYKLNGVKVWRLKIQNHYWPFLNKERSKIDKLRWHVKDIRNKSYKNKVTEIIHDFKPSIIHTNNISGFSVYIWVLAKNNQIKIVHTIRDYYLQCPNASKFRNNTVCERTCLDCKVLSFLKKKESNKVNYVVGISDFTLKEHINRGYFERVKKVVVYNGFTIDFSIEKKQKFINGEIKFGFIGQIIPSKGIELLLKSFVELEKFKNWKLIIAGAISKQYENKLKRISNTEKIEFLGYVDSAEFFEKIDVLIVPSIWNEPFGRVVLEGLIYNKVVIGSNRGGIPELLKKNPLFIFNPDKNELISLLKKILEKPSMLNRYKIDRNNLLEFSMEKKVESYKKIYQNLLEE